MNITIGENIRKLRKQRNVTQEALADHLAITPQAISRWESGAGYPAIEYLPDLAGFFGVSVDELLGVRLSEREAKRESIYRAVARMEEDGYTPSAFSFLREAQAEFPGDRTIRLALARALASSRQEEQPDQASLQEAEKILRDLIRQADDQHFRFACISELAVLYKEAWQDEHGYEEIVSMLPEISTCREYFLTNMYSGASQKPEVLQDCILKLSRWIGNLLRDYVAFVLPNDEENWDSKISRFHWLIGFLTQVSVLLDREKSRDLLPCIAALHRYTATYHAARNEQEETLGCLEEMCRLVEAFCTEEKEAGDNRTGSHGLASSFLSCLDQNRYDPVRNSRRFQAVRSRLTALSGNENAAED